MGEPEPRSDRVLVEQFRAGDREAFTALYRLHFPSVYRFAFYMTADRIRAGEITQDVFVWLVHHPGEFDAERGDLMDELGGEPIDRVVNGVCYSDSNADRALDIANEVEGVSVQEVL